MYASKTDSRTIFDVVKYGITWLSIIPMRREPSHRSEQVSQLLFGECYELVQQQSNWLLIRCTYDGYEGWIDENQHHSLNEKEYQQTLGSDTGLALDLVCSAASGQHAIPVLTGSHLPYFDGMNFKIGKEKFIYNGQAIPYNGRQPSLCERVAMRYLHAPYLWGGRSPFGIDCSGLTQVVYKFMGMALPRDAWQQAERGTTVHFIEDTRPGDLAFFHNEEGKVTHTGILLNDKRIIHASGRVRMDKADHFGIYNSETKKYSHQLKSIKRFF